MLKVGLDIQEPYLLEALKELFLQAGVCVKENEKEWDCMVFTPPFSKDFSLSPSLNFATLSLPIRFIELLSLVEGLPYSQEIVFSHFKLDLREKILKNIKTKEVQRLTEKECLILRFFHQHRGKELSKSMLLKEIWSYHPETKTHTLETHIYRLRQKLEKDPNNPQIILNRKEGYCLTTDNF